MAEHFSGSGHQIENLKAYSDGSSGFGTGVNTWYKPLAVFQRLPKQRARRGTLISLVRPAVPRLIWTPQTPARFSSTGTLEITLL